MVANILVSKASGHRRFSAGHLSDCGLTIGVNLRQGDLNLSFHRSSLSGELRGVTFMAKRRGNPNWGKPEPIGPITPTITEFEQVVREYKLSPDQYLRSTRLREWARRNKNSKYIPEPLLEAWGFEIESTL